MSEQTNELRNIIVSLTNIAATLESQENQAPPDEVSAPVPAVEPPVAPEVPVAVPEAPVETPAEEAAEEASEPSDGQVADNTPSATVTVG